MLLAMNSRKCDSIMRRKRLKSIELVMLFADGNLRDNRVDRNDEAPR